MIIVYYCSASALSNGVWSSGVKHFKDHAEFGKWLEDSMDNGPVLVTSVQVR